MTFFCCVRARENEYNHITPKPPASDQKQDTMEMQSRVIPNKANVDPNTDETANFQSPSPNTDDAEMYHSANIEHTL